MKRLTFALLCATAARAEEAEEAGGPPQHPRTRALAAEQVLSENDLYGGAVEAELEAAPLDFTVPTLLNGVEMDGLADFHLELQLRYAAANVLGGRNAGEFVPYQKVHVTIVNTTTASADDTIEMDLVPHAGHAEGWHYASNVLLPPGDSEADPFEDAYRVTVTLAPAMTIATHADASPPSGLFARVEPLVLFDRDVAFGGILQMPVGDVEEQLDRVAAYADILAALDANDFSGAAASFEASLAGMFEGRMDVAGYDAARGITEAQLADLSTNVESALAQTGPAPDCLTGGAVVASECKEWIKKGIERAFYLSILHEIDEARRAIAEGALDAVEGAAHKWDEAWAYFRALEATAGKRQTNCDDGRFGAGIACGMEAAIEAALLSGANAILIGGGAGFDAARAVVERELLQVEYLAVVHEIIAMREKILVADDAGYNKARVEARAFYRTIAYLFAADDDAVLIQAFEERDSTTFAQGDAVTLVESLNATMNGLLQADELAQTEVIP
ncbi:MAG: iron transporter [Myxococcota bacterium]